MKWIRLNKYIVLEAVSIIKSSFEIDKVDIKIDQKSGDFWGDICFLGGKR